MYIKKKKDVSAIHPLIFVGVKGFEPSTPCSQSRCANRTALRPEDVFFKRDAKVCLLFFICKYLGNFFSKKVIFSVFCPKNGLFLTFLSKNQCQKIFTVKLKLCFFCVLSYKNKRIRHRFHSRNS